MTGRELYVVCLVGALVAYVAVALPVVLLADLGPGLALLLGLAAGAAGAHVALWLWRRRRSVRPSQEREL